MATEKRLIDANALKDKLQEHHDFFVNAWGGFSNLPLKDKARVDEITSFIADIVNAPTVDAVEVKHGQWISLTECANAGVYCSVCHKKVWKEDYAWCNRKNKLRSNYCPHCGAKMDM